MFPKSLKTRTHHLRRKLGLHGKAKPGDMISRANDLQSGRIAMKHKKHRKAGEFTKGGPKPTDKTNAPAHSPKKHRKSGPESDSGSHNGKSPANTNKTVGKSTRIFNKHRKAYKHYKGKLSFEDWYKQELKEPEHQSKKHRKVRPAKPQGKGIVKALGQKGTTGNFAKIEKAKGKGAAIGALQNKLAKHQGRPAPYHRKGK